MKLKLPHIFFLFFMMLTLTSCVGSPSDGKCIAPDQGQTLGSGSGGGGSGGGGSGGGSSQDSSAAAKIDKFLKENKIITTVVDKIKAKVLGDSGFFGMSSSPSQSLFQGFVASPEYQSGIAGAFMLYILIYGLTLTAGMTQATMGDAVIRVAKIAFVALFAMNWNLFYSHIGVFFTNGTDEIMGYFMQNFEKFYQLPGGGGSGGGSDIWGGAAANSPFLPLDNFIARIFSIQTFALISALTNSGQYAPVYAAFMGFSLWFIFEAILKVVSIYIFSIFAKSLLFALAPIFLAFLLFNQTRPMFDAWLKQLVSFSLQPILATAYIGLFIGLIAPFFDEFASYKLCYLKLDDSSNKSGWKFVDPNSTEITPVDFGTSSEPPISLQTTLLFLMFAWLFKSALGMIDNMIMTIVGSATGDLGSINAMRNLTADSSKSPLANIGHHVKNG